MSDKSKKEVETPRSPAFSLKNVRISFPSIFQPKPFKENDDNPKYQADFLLPKSDTKQVEKVKSFLEPVIKDVMKLKAKDMKKNGDTAIRPSYIMFQDGDLEENEIYHDHWIIKARRSVKMGKPEIVDPLGNRLADTPENRRLFQGGNYVDANINFWHAVSCKDPYVSVSLNVVRFRKEGEPFGGGGVNVDTAFDDLDDEDLEEVEDDDSLPF
jgi:hypothetical protein